MPTEEQTYRKSISDKLDGQDEMLAKIFKQTSATNGRVTKLETRLGMLAVAIIVILALKFPEIYEVIKAVV